MPEVDISIKGDSSEFKRALKDAEAASRTTAQKVKEDSAAASVYDLKRGPVAVDITGNAEAFNTTAADLKRGPVAVDITGNAEAFNTTAADLKRGPVAVDITGNARPFNTASVKARKSVKNPVTIDIKGNSNSFQVECTAIEDRAKRTAEKVRQSMGRALEKAGSKLGAGGLGGGGVAGIATAGAIAIATKGMDLYLAAQEKAAEAMKRNAAEAGYAAEQEAKRAAAIINTTNAIAQLNSAELNSNAGKEKAIQLLQQMQRRYTDLSVAIDENGRVTEESLKAAQKLALQRKANAVKKQMDANEQTRTRFVEMSNDPLVNLRGKSEEYAIEADKLATENQKLSDTLHELSLQIREVDKNFENVKKMRAAQEKDYVESESKRLFRETNNLGTRRTYEEAKQMYIHNQLETARKANGGTLSEESEKRLSAEYGKFYDSQQSSRNSDRLLNLQDQMAVRLMELQGRTKDAAYQKKFNEAKRQLGRDLTDKEESVLMLETDAEFAVKKAQAFDERAKLGRPNVANPWQSDSLIQMGEKVNMVQSINYPQKTYSSVSSIEKISEKILNVLNSKTTGDVYFP